MTMTMALYRTDTARVFRVPRSAISACRRATRQASTASTSWLGTVRTLMVALARQGITELLLVLVATPCTDSDGKRHRSISSRVACCRTAAVSTALPSAESGSDERSNGVLPLPKASVGAAAVLRPSLASLLLLELAPAPPALLDEGHCSSVPTATPYSVSQQSKGWYTLGMATDVAYTCRQERNPSLLGTIQGEWLRALVCVQYMQMLEGNDAMGWRSARGRE